MHPLPTADLARFTGSGAPGLARPVTGAVFELGPRHGATVARFRLVDGSRRCRAQIGSRLSRVYETKLSSPAASVKASFGFFQSLPRHPDAWSVS